MYNGVILVFATRIVQSLYFLNTKFQASSHLVWSYSLVCVGPGRKPEDRFCHNKAHTCITSVVSKSEISRLYFTKLSSVAAQTGPKKGFLAMRLNLQGSCSFPSW